MGQSSFVDCCRGPPITETKSFKYLGSLFNSEASCDEEVKSRLAIARQRMGELMPIWKSRTISNRLKARLIKALVWPIVTYGSEAWTLNKELEGNIGAFEMHCYRRSMRSSGTEHVTNGEVLQRVGQDRALMGQVKSRKLKYFGRVSRHNSLEKDIVLGTMPGTRRQEGQKRQWIDNVTQWTGKSLVDIVRLAENRDMYRRFVYGVAYTLVYRARHILASLSSFAFTYTVVVFERPSHKCSKIDAKKNKFWH